MRLRVHVLTPLVAAAAVLAMAVLPSVPGLDVHITISLSARGMQWGLWEPNWQTSDGTADFSQFTHMESELGHRADLVHWYASWSENWSYDGPLAQQVVSSGRTPFITWEANGRSLQRIENGDYDAYITSWAQGMAKMAPAPVYLRIFHEFNDPYQGSGSGYTWGDNGGTGNTPADLVAAWRHIHDLFAAAKAGNVRFVWCPDGANADLSVLRASYPGDAYVDYAGWDEYGYDIDAVYSTLGQVTQKPLIVPEYGDTSGSAVTTWADALDAGKYDRVKAVIWFDDKSWRLDNLPDVRSSVTQMLAGTAFQAPPPSPSPSPSASGSPSPAPSPSVAPSAAPTPSPTPSAVPSASPRPSQSPSAVPSAVPSVAPTPSPRASP